MLASKEHEKLDPEEQKTFCEILIMGKCIFMYMQIRNIFRIPHFHPSMHLSTCLSIFCSFIRRSGRTKFGELVPLDPATWQFCHVPTHPHFLKSTTGSIAIVLPEFDFYLCLPFFGCQIISCWWKCYLLSLKERVVQKRFLGAISRLQNVTSKNECFKRTCCAPSLIKFLLWSAVSDMPKLTCPMGLSLLIFHGLAYPWTYTAWTCMHSGPINSRFHLHI